MNTAAAHTDADGFARRCSFCRGEVSIIAWDDNRLSCDNCGEIQPWGPQSPKGI